MTMADLREEMMALSTGAVKSETFDIRVDPEVAFSEIIDRRGYAYWLDAGPSADSGWSYMGQVGGGFDESPGFVILGEPDQGRTRILQPATGCALDVEDSVIGVVSDTLRRLEALSEGCSLGCVGWIGYESAALESGAAPRASTADPDSVLLYPARQIAFDHSRRQVRLSSLLTGDAESDDQWRRRMLAALRALDGRCPTEPVRPPELEPVTARSSPGEYRAQIEECQRRIADGDAYQLCLTNQFRTTTDEDPLAIYQRLRRINPTQHGGFIVAGEHSLLSSSPEMFLDVASDGLVTTKPIKGTRRRGGTPREDRHLLEELRNDSKELAENLMIVDLMRNDLTSVSELGSVVVPSLFDVEEHPNVFQLVSTVRGRLRPGTSLRQLLRSTFPAGSMTGAPKAAAMQILHGLEASPRGAYAGAFGYMGVDGNVRLAMTIRTIMLNGSEVRIGSGGGITALSQPDFEIEETVIKIRPLLTALGSSIGDFGGYR